MSPALPSLHRALPLVLALAAAPALAADGAGKAAPTGWVHAVQKHNGSAVAVAWRVGAEAPAGQGVSVELQLSGVADPAGATVRITADAGLKLQGDGADGAPIALRPGATRTLGLTVVPQSEGLFYVNVFTSQRGQGSVASVPVRTAGAAEAAKAAASQPQKAPSGERLLTMPVK